MLHNLCSLEINLAECSKAVLLRGGKLASSHFPVENWLFLYLKLFSVDIFVLPRKETPCNFSFVQRKKGEKKASKLGTCLTPIFFYVRYVGKPCSEVPSCHVTPRNYLWALVRGLTQRAWSKGARPLISVSFRWEKSSSSTCIELFSQVKKCSLTSLTIVRYPIDILG